MPRVIGVGVIGMGWMGEVHSRSYRQIVERFPECPLHPRLVICADDVEARSSAARSRFGFEKQTTDWRRVIERSGCRNCECCCSEQPASRNRPSRGQPRQAHLLREAGRPESPGNCGNRAPCPSSGCHDFRWLQLSLGPVGAVWTEADSRRCVGQSHSLSRSFLCRIRQRSQGCSVMAISARPCRTGSPGRLDVARHRYGPLHRRFDSRSCWNASHVHSRTPLGDCWTRDSFYNQHRWTHRQGHE